MSKDKQERQPDVVLQYGEYEGVEVFMDFSTTTRGEYRELFNTKGTEERENEILAKCCHLEPDDFEKMSLWDFREFNKAYHFRAANPLNDPKN